MIPFTQSDQLTTTIPLDHIPTTATLPGYPRISLSKSNTTQVRKFLSSQFRSRDLERMAPRLWWMSKHDSSSISPLHRQRVKGREIIITEDPKLHLVWIYNRIFVKPVPEYLFSWKVWEGFIVPPGRRRGGEVVVNVNSGSETSNGSGTTSTSRIPNPKTRNYSTTSNDDTEADDLLYKSALGYLRTWYHLIQHESDFRIAHSLHLLPSHITWPQFCHFTAHLPEISDSQVSQRYEYGELRLTRLNFYGKFILRKRYVQRVEAQYGHYFARFYGPLLFIFGILSVMLSALQVEVTVEQAGVESGGLPWRQFRLASRGLSIAVLVGVAVLVAVLIVLFLEKFGKEWAFALKDHYTEDKIDRRQRSRSMSEKGEGRERGSQAV